MLNSVKLMTVIVEYVVINMNVNRRTIIENEWADIFRDFTKKMSIMQYERKFNTMEKPILYCYRVDEDTGKLDCYTVDDYKIYSLGAFTDCKNIRFDARLVGLKTKTTINT